VRPGDDQGASASGCDVAEEGEHLESEKRARGAGVVAEVDVPEAVRDHPWLRRVRERHYHLSPGARTRPRALTEHRCEGLVADRIEGTMPFGVLEPTRALDCPRGAVVLLDPLLAAHFAPGDRPHRGGIVAAEDTRDAQKPQVIELGALTDAQHALQHARSTRTQPALFLTRDRAHLTTATASAEARTDRHVRAFHRRAIDCC
jgi:hypothetical protein